MQILSFWLLEAWIFALEPCLKTLMDEIQYYSQATQKAFNPYSLAFGLLN